MKIELECGDEIVLGIEPVESNRAIIVEREGDGETRVLVDGDVLWHGDLTQSEDPRPAVPDGPVKKQIQLWDTLGAFIIVEAPTNILYSNQTGGTACGHPMAEGWLLPLHRWSWAEVEEDLRNITRDHWGDAALGRLSKGALYKLEAAVHALKLTGLSDAPDKIRLDHYRLDKTKNGEAWVPVLTPYGKGWLTWENSD